MVTSLARDPRELAVSGTLLFIYASARVSAAALATAQRLIV